MDSGARTSAQALDWAKRGFEFLKNGSSRQAIEAFERAIEAQADSEIYHFGLGEALRLAERNVDAEAAFRRALELRPDFGDGRIALGILQLTRGVPQAALGELERAVIARPSTARAWLWLGIARLAMGAVAEAEEAALRVLALAADDVTAHALLGIAQEIQGRAQESSASFARALTAGPSAHGQVEELASSFHNMGRPQEALIAFRHLAKNEQWARRSIHKLLEVTLDRPERDMAESQIVRRAWGRLMTRDLAPLAHDNRPDPERRLRLGFVGSIFCVNSSRHVILPILKAHDRARYEMFLYSNTRREDGVTADYRHAADHWRVIRALDQRAAARMIRDDGIDILIDLNGISEDHRLDIFAAKPAPVQISAWGYAAGTGLPTIDAMFTDPWAVHPDEVGHFAETIIHLPCWACFDPDDVPPLDKMTPSDGPVFGSLTRIRKLADESYDLWAAILKRVPGSKLLLKDFALDDPLIARRVADAFFERGIGRSRLELLGASDRAEHLRTLGRIDVALSPVPHSGGVTTFEALALGVPVVALDGHTVAERGAGAILQALGRGRWVAKTPEEYVAIAAELAVDRDVLRSLREDLPREIRKYPACNPALYFAAVDAAYRQLWRAWCARAA